MENLNIFQQLTNNLSFSKKFKPLVAQEENQQDETNEIVTEKRQAKKLKHDKTKDDDDQFNLLGTVSVKTNKNKKKINKLKLEQIKIEQVINLSIF